MCTDVQDNVLPSSICHDIYKSIQTYSIILLYSCIQTWHSKITKGDVLSVTATTHGYLTATGNDVTNAKSEIMRKIRKYCHFVRELSSRDRVDLQQLTWVQTRHNFVGEIRIFSVKIRINPYPSFMHRCIANTFTRFIPYHTSLQKKSRHCSKEPKSEL